MALLEHSKVKTWTKNVNWGIGPTDDTALRNVPVHVTTHNDGNSIYVAPNGDDGAGTGTAANPFLTIDKAFGTLGGKIIVTIERNGWTGVDMIFDAPDVDNPVPLTLQVEEGEVATIKRSNIILTNSNSLSKDWAGITYYPGTDTFWACAANDYIYKSTDGYTWSIVNPAPINVVKVWQDIDTSDTIIAGVTGTTPGDFIYSSDDGASWTIVALSYRLLNMHYANGVWMCTYVDSPNGGIAWSTDLTTWNYVEFDLIYNTVAWKITFGNNIWVVSTNNKLHYSRDDGRTWQLSNSPSRSWELIYYANDRFLAGISDGTSDSKIYYSDNGIDWLPSNSIATAWNHAYYDSGKYVAVGGTFGVPQTPSYSFNGIDWFPISGVAYYSSKKIVGKNGTFVITDASAGVIRIIQDTVIKITGNSMVLNGFYLDGNNVAGNMITGLDATAGTFKFLESQNIMYNGINNFDSPAISECILKNLENDGVTSCKSPSIDHCVFNHIDGVGVSQEDDTVDMDHLTFNDCGTAIKINEAIVTTTKLVDLIINKCANAINSVTTPLTVSTSVLNGVLTNVTPDGASLIGSKALFIDILNDDLNLRHIEEGYPINSPGVGLATVGTDSGAYDVDFVGVSTTWQSLDISNKCIGIEKRKIFVAPDQAHGLNGDLKRDYIDDLWEYSITARESADQQVLQHFHNIAKSNNITRFFPVGRDMQSFTSPMTGNDVVWNTKSSVDGIVIVTLTTANKAIFETFIGDNTAAGWYMAIKSISGTIAPHDNIYPYKIIEYNPNGTVYLENIHNRFPGTGMAANPDGTYSVMAGQSLFISTLQYTGTNTDNNYLLQMIDQNQAWIADQWVGYYVRFSSAFLPFVRYLRIVGNTGDVLTCDDPLGKSSFLVLNNYYWSTIDLIMTKARLNDVDSQTKGQPKEYGHHGNDWYSTKVTREENTLSNKHNYLAYNETGEQVVLVETSEFDADLL